MAAVTTTSEELDCGWKREVLCSEVTASVVTGRLRAEMMPVVTVSSSPNGLPIAMTSWPTTRSSESAKDITCRSEGGSTSLITARSVVGSVPTTVAS